ncbi:MAG: hypothetical protein WBA93_10840 [Microcoleaceae cyanobacterium]
MAVLCCRLKKRSPKLTDDNLPVDNQVIYQWLGDCIQIIQQFSKL